MNNPGNKEAALERAKLQHRKMINKLKLIELTDEEKVRTQERLYKHLDNLETCSEECGEEIKEQIQERIQHTKQNFDEIQKQISVELRSSITELQEKIRNREINIFQKGN